MMQTRISRSTSYLIPMNIFFRHSAIARRNEIAYWALSGIPRNHAVKGAAKLNGKWVGTVAPSIQLLLEP